MLIDNSCFKICELKWNCQISCQLFRVYPQLISHLSVLYC